MTLKGFIARWLSRCGLRIVTRNSPLFYDMPPNVEPAFAPIFETCAPYTCTSVDAQYALFRAAEYVVKSGIPGDIVECGVFKGGSVMVAAMSLQHFGDRERRLWLYDTFEGMTEPTERDVDFLGRTPAQHLGIWGAKTMGEMARSSVEQVRANLAKTGLPADRFYLIQGRVEDTLPIQAPSGAISILRLDTDWYESTRHELIHLFPLLSPGGVIVIDDYGFWRGCREACDEHFQKRSVPILLNRIDRTGAVIGINPWRSGG